MIMDQFKHLEEHVIESLALNDEDRFHFLDSDRWIGYKKAVTVIDMLTDILNRPRKLRPECLLIVGDSNMGKTTIINEFAKKYFTQRVDDVDMNLLSLTRPVIPIQAPAKPKIKDLYINILECFVVPYRVTDPEVKLRIQVIHKMRQFQTKMLIIDELHNFLSGSARQQQEVMNTLKTLSNELSLNIVGVGTREATLILHTDAQYSSRFDIVDLPKWELNEEFLKLLFSYARLLPLRKPSNLVSEEIATLLFEISEGNLGDLNRLLVACAKEAITSGTEEITIQIIKKYSDLKPTAGARNIRYLNLNRL